MILTANSRYSSTDIAWMTAPDGTQLAYLRRRFVPPPGRLADWREYTVEQDDRLDLIAGLLLADPEQFWRICDANRAMRPDALVETVGRRLRIALPEGIPGVSIV